MSSDIGNTDVAEHPIIAAPDIYYQSPVKPTSSKPANLRASSPIDLLRAVQKHREKQLLCHRALMSLSSKLPWTKHQESFAFRKACPLPRWWKRKTNSITHQAWPGARQPRAATQPHGIAAPTVTFHSSEIREGLNLHTKAIPDTEIALSEEQMDHFRHPAIRALPYSHKKDGNSHVSSKASLNSKTFASKALDGASGDSGCIPGFSPASSLPSDLISLMCKVWIILLYPWINVGRYVCSWFVKCSNIDGNGNHAHFM